MNSPTLTNFLLLGKALVQLTLWRAKPVVDFMTFQQMYIFWNEAN